DLKAGRRRPRRHPRLPPRSRARARSRPRPGRARPARTRPIRCGPPRRGSRGCLPRERGSGGVDRGNREVPPVAHQEGGSWGKHGFPPGSELKASDVHTSHLLGGIRFNGAMAVAAPVPPFETFYETHREEVLGFLRKRVGSDRADDAFQETFLRALRAYSRLEHGLHLRAWVLTIASRIVLDDARRQKPQGELPELASEESWRPAFEELAPLTEGLPPKERAAVVLRYGYDLGY